MGEFVLLLFIGGDSGTCLMTGKQAVAVDAARRQAEDGLREAADVFASRLFRHDILQPVNG
jgi:hypothetical protein